MKEPMSQGSPVATDAKSVPDLRRAGSVITAGARRLPYTATLLVIIAIFGIVTTNLWTDLYDTVWWDRLAYGVPALEAGRWWTPVTGAFLAQSPRDHFPALVFFVVACGLCEWRLGWRRTAIATVGGQLLGVFGAAGILVLGRAIGWQWAAYTADELDAGWTAGATAALIVWAYSLRAPWRPRIVIGTLGYCVISLVWVGRFEHVENIIAVVFGMGMGLHMAGPRLRSRSPTMTRHEVRIIAALLFVVVATAQLLAMGYPDEGPLGPSGLVVTRPLFIVFIVLQLLIAAGLHRGSRLAWWIAIGLTVIGLLGCLELRSWPRSLAAAVLYLPLFLLLVRSRRAYTADVSPPTWRRIRRDLVLIVIGFVGYVVLGFTLIHGFSPAATPSEAVNTVFRRAFFSSSGALTATTRPAHIFLDSLSLVPIAVLLTVVLLLVLRTHRPAAATGRERALELLHTYGGGNMSWMATWADNVHFITADGHAAVTYQVHSGTAIVLGDPIGAPASVDRAVLEFARYCELQGFLPCLFSSTSIVFPQTRQLHWRNVQVAEDTVIDLPTLHFKGKAWQDVRTALNKAAKTGVTFRLSRLQDESFAMVQQCRGISDQWVTDKGMPEMGFTLGGMDEAWDPEVRVGLAVDGVGVLQGVTSWLPVYGEAGEVRGWTLDVMRRRPDGFRNVMEFMIASACLGFKETGAQTVSLSGAPLARSEDADQLGAVDVVLNQLGETLEPVYGFRTLHQFKTKFKPRYVPMYMIYTDEAALPRIGIALTQAFLPGASLRQYASMLASVRG